MTAREERRKRGEEKRIKYAGDLLAAADECVKQKVSQQTFHTEIMTRRQLMEKACPQEKQLIAEAVNSIAAKLSEMEAGLHSVPYPKPKAEKPDKKRHRFPRGERPRKGGQHPYPEPL